MESKGADRIVVAKPVASRPSSSIIRPFADIAGASNPLDVGPETTSTGPIKPKTVRFTPTLNHALPPAVPSKVDSPRSDIKPTVLYKPLAKVVSKAEASALANMGNIEPNDQQVKPPARAWLEPLALRIEKPISSRTQLRSKSLDDLKGLLVTASGNCSSSLPVEESRDLPPAASADRPSYDGYNWRKYGQKQVKGSEYPRSYYKCTHPNCQVKKKVERSLDGQIAEIVYKGEHNHAKPRPPKRGSGSAAQDVTVPSMSSRAIERNEGPEVKAEATNSIRLKGSVAQNCVVDRELTTARLNPDDSCGLSGEREDDRTLRLGIDPDEPRSKRRKTKNQQNGVESNAGIPQEPRASGQGSVDPEVRDDGFRWRKYGQKVVKGNPHPRSYYKCTSADCSVRKLVERALDDPAVCITTYEGKHNHEMPLRSMRVSSSEPNLRACASKEKRPI